LFLFVRIDDSQGNTFRHCEERSDAAIQRKVADGLNCTGLLRFARNDGLRQESKTFRHCEERKRRGNPETTAGKNEYWIASLRSQ
jgi:hypothetical protein